MDDGRETAIGTGIAARHCPCRPYEPQHDQWSIKKKVLTPIADTIQPLKERPILELDELWSFVQSKANKQWIWIAMDAKTRQIIAFHVGDRRGESGKALWAKMPMGYRAQATFHTDQYDVYKGVIPAAQHKAITKQARKTNHIERFNNTLRQRVSRLVRETLSFSKTLANHIGAIKYFICHYNLTRRGALPV